MQYDETQKNFQINRVALLQLPLHDVLMILLICFFSIIELCWQKQNPVKMPDHEMIHNSTIFGVFSDIIAALQLFFEEWIGVLMVFEDHENGLSCVVAQNCFDIDLEIVVDALLFQLLPQSFKLDQV